MLTRLGFPAIGGQRRFVTAIAVDAVGSGVFLPVSLLYFLSATSMSLVHIGLALSIAAGVQIPTGPLLGGAVDRFGARRVLLAANLLELVGFIGYLFADSFVTVLLPAIVVQLGITAFWGSYSPVVAHISAPEERERWFGFLGALRNASLAIGGLVAAVAISIDTHAAYTTVVMINAFSYLAAFLLLLAAPYAGATGQVSRGEVAGGAWRRVLADRPYLLLVTTNFAYAMSAMALNVAMPVYITRVLGLPGWLAGTVFTVNTVLIGLGQGLAVNAMGGFVRSRVIALGMVFSAVSFAVLYGASLVGLVVGVVVVLLAALVYTGGELLCGPVITTLSTDAAPVELRGRYVSLYQMSWTVAMTVAPVALTWLLDAGAAALWGALAGSALGGGVLALLLRRVMPLAAGVVPARRTAAAGAALDVAAVSG